MLICFSSLDPQYLLQWQGKKLTAVTARIPCLTKCNVKTKVPLTFKVILEFRSSICMGTTSGISSSSKKGPRPLSTEVSSSKSQPWRSKCRKPFFVASGEWTAAPGPTSKRRPTAGLMGPVFKVEDSWKLVSLRRQKENILTNSQGLLNTLHVFNIYNNLCQKFYHHSHLRDEGTKHRD